MWVLFICQENDVKHATVQRSTQISQKERGKNHGKRKRKLRNGK